MWKDFDARFKHILERLRRHREFIERQAALLHFNHFQRNVYETQKQIAQYQQHRSMFISHFENQSREENEKKYFAVQEWILAAQSKLDHEAFCSVRAAYPGTGSWILTHETVMNWREASTPVNSILWLNGIPGAGCPHFLMLSSGSTIRC